MSKNAGISSRRKPKNYSAELATSRSVASQVLARVWEQQAYASVALDAELMRHPRLDDKERRLCTELVYGVLRTTRELERHVDAYAKRDGYKNKACVRAPLLMAVYSLLALDRVPPFAAVSEAVGAIKRGPERQMGGFCNAVLRKITADVERDGRPDRRELWLRSLPRWLRKRLDDSLGADATERFIGEAELPPPLCLCLAAGESRDHWLQELQRQAPKQARIEAGALSPRCIVTRGVGDPRKLDGCGDRWWVQEEGAQLLALSTGAREGEAVLDACAGRGGKSFLLCDAVGDNGRLDAADRHPAKLERLVATGARGQRIAATYAVDWTRGSAEVPDGYDRALVDAPCSGVGTLRRRPEILDRLSAHDLARFAALQLAITRRVASRVRDGGRLIYAVCSVLREEAEQVVEVLGRSHDGVRLEPAPFDNPVGQRLAGEASSFRLLPQEHGTDGYFAASFIVRHD